MSDEFSPKGLRDEWTLLVHTFLEDGLVQPEFVQQIKPDDIIRFKKELSSKRKKLNQAIEKIKIKIEKVTGVIENLELVGSDTQGLIKEIDFLNHEGETISEEIFQLDKKIKKLNQLQDQSEILHKNI